MRCDKKVFMKFIDEALITVKAGHGGKGCVSFRREKYEPRGGPNGGNGGRGGSIIFVTSTDMSTLLDFQYKREFRADDGQYGMGSDCDGRGGEDIIVPVPIGTSVFSAESGELLCDMMEKDQQIVIAKGGRGGKGNKHFVTSTHQAPLFAQEGEEGEVKTIRMELKLLADVGLIGTPNAGKSTFLSVVSKAKPKVADYPFTTLSPVLGVVHHKDTKPFVIADLPGLIEGAHEGKGMGDKFLKHAERTRAILHLVSLSPDEVQTPKERYRVVYDEMLAYDPGLAKKPQIIVLTKCDLVDEETVKAVKKEFKSIKNTALIVISSVANKNVDVVLDKLTELLFEKKINS